MVENKNWKCVKRFYHSGNETQLYLHNRFCFTQVHLAVTQIQTSSIEPHLIGILLSLFIFEMRFIRLVPFNWMTYLPLVFNSRVHTDTWTHCIRIIPLIQTLEHDGTREMETNANKSAILKGSQYLKMYVSILVTGNRLAQTYKQMHGEYSIHAIASPLQFSVSSMSTHKMNSTIANELLN